MVKDFGSSSCGFVGELLFLKGYISVITAMHTSEHWLLHGSDLMAVQFRRALTHRRSKAIRHNQPAQPDREMPMA